MTRIIGTLLLFISLSAFGFCTSEPDFTSEDVGSKDKPLLMIVHASRDFDSRQATANGVEFTINYAKQNNFEILHLKDSGNYTRYFDARVTCDGKWWESNGGELKYKVKAETVHMIGGHLELCFNTAINQLIYGWAQQNQNTNYNIVMYADAIYSNGKLVDQKDSYYDRFQAFLGAVIYGRPGGEYWPKVTLLETLGVIIDVNKQYEYVERALPRFDKTMPDYVVTIQIDGWSPKVIQSPKNAKGRLNFIIKETALKS